MKLTCTDTRARFVDDGQDAVWVPTGVAVCPECGGRMLLEVTGCDAETGEPVEEGVEVQCEREPDIDDPEFWDRAHRRWQSEWMPVIERVTTWARRCVRVVEGDA